MELHQVQVYKPALGEPAEMMSAGQCQAIGDLDDSQLVGAAAAVVDKEVSMAEAAAEVKEAKSSVVGKKRRGRPPGQGRAKATPVRKKNEEEDVCFICFDGGSLVLCDRRGCPKAYHPSCIKRDEAFFKSKAKWNCGWHICSSCQKASHYMCYTCTYSMCKGCIKDADYQCVQGNKGFCGTCMRTIMLIENAQENKEAAQVDFDDKSSWEYLFKVYWILLKGQLSLTLDDLINAKNPYKGPAVVACQGGASNEIHVAHKTVDSGSLNSCVDLGAVNSNGFNKKPRIGEKGMSFPEGTSWATKELLELVAHMKNGDVSVLSQFGVQALLLEYIKKNNLRDPHQKSQIICDQRLRNLFGKECVGHFEMLKLLEYHYLLKESSMEANNIGAGFVNAVATEMEIDGNEDNQLMMCSDKRRKTRKRIDERVTPTNLDAYAAIDVHNINLIYLRRNLLEILLDDVDKFHERVVGSIVRIRISSSDQKHDTYRLVPVIGTNKVAEGYKIGTRTTDMKLEISNLDKKEILPIDQISDQEFSEDECKRLRQSIKCGLMKRFTVGEIQDKAMVLRTVRVNDELAAEILRLNHLRDRASENGRRKELRELVEKLQLLDSPEERKRRLNEIPGVHSDPKMDPSYVSEDSGGKDQMQDGSVKSRRAVSGRKERVSFSPQREGGISNKSGSKTQKNQTREAFGINGLNTTTNQASAIGLVCCGRTNESAIESKIASEVGSENSSGSFSAVMKANLPIESFQMEKIWFYRDPTGKVQGPFAMVQLCKWNTTGVFPPDHRVWRINEKEDDSILLTDALKGKYCRKPLLTNESNIQSQGLKVSLDERNSGLDGRWNKSMNETPIDGKKGEESRNTKQDGQTLQNSGNTEVVRNSTAADAVNLNEKQSGDSGSAEVLRSGTPADNVNSNAKQAGIHNVCSTEVIRSRSPADAVNYSEKQTGIHKQGCDSVKIDSPLSNQPQECSSLTSTVLSVKPDETLSHQEGEGTTENNYNQKNENMDWRQTSQDQMNDERGNENRSDSEGQSVQSSAQNWIHAPANSPSNGCDFTSDFVPVAKTRETSEQDERELDFPDFSSPTPKRSSGDVRGEASENNPSLSSNLPVQDGGHSWSDSNVVGGGEQLHKVVADWGGYSPTPAKPSVEEWDSSLVSASSLKPSEIPSNFVATSVSVSGQMTEPIISQPTSNASSWPEFCTESVSDLLAEVEAMESLCGLATPTSIMHFGGEFIEGSKNDSISSVEGFSPAPEPKKGDALSVTCDLQLLSELVVTGEPLAVCQTRILDPQLRSGVRSSTSPQGDGKPSDVPVKELEANVSVDQMEASEIQMTAPPKECWDMSSTDNPWKAGLESTEASTEAVQGSINAKWGGSNPGGTNVHDLQQISGLHSSKSNEGVRKPSVSVNQPKANVSVVHLEPGEIPITAPSKESWDVSSAADNPWKSRLESRETSCEAVQGNVNAGWGQDRGSTNIGWGGPDPGNANVGWRDGQGTIQGNTFINASAPAGGTWEGQSRHGGDKSSGPRGRSFPNRDVGFGKGKYAGDRQTLYGNRNGGGGSFRQPPRGQRVCKYYESGCCRKGGSCTYLHPS